MASGSDRSARTQPFSIRLGKTAELLIADESRRAGRSRSAIVEELAEEEAKMRLFPGIAFRGHPRRAWVIGSALDVWEIVSMLHSYDEDQERLRENHPLLADRHIRLARAYAERFPEEIAPFVEESARPLDELVSLYPFLEVAR
jgi:hypothetical protein